MRKFTTLNVPNKYFQFKKFRIEQVHAAMKVTTEGSILGAMAGTGMPKRILDIGAGTGLVSLMLAQRFDSARIDAVEIEPNAVKDTLLNFGRSLWVERLALFETDIRIWDTKNRYDLIVSNPPFFKNSFKSTSQQKNTAIHNELLSQEDLLHATLPLLSVNGTFVVIYPELEADNFKVIAESAGLFCSEQINVYDHKEASILRKIITYSRTSSFTTEKNMIIKIEKGGDYTRQFVAIMKPFYLYL